MRQESPTFLVNFARLISLLTHPLLFLVGLTWMATGLHDAERVYLFIFLCIWPALLYLLSFLIKKDGTLFEPGKFPRAVVFAGFLLALGFLNAFPGLLFGAGGLFYIRLLGWMGLCCGVLFGVTLLWFKNSIHTAGWSGICFVYGYLGNWPYFALSLAIFSAVWWARQFLGAHTLFELIFGGLSGVVIAGLMILSVQG